MAVLNAEVRSCVEFAARAMSKALATAMVESSSFPEIDSGR
jgi:hypothetical protein